MHYAAVLLVALAGLCCCWSAWRWWVLIRRNEAEAARPTFLYLGVVSLTVGLGLSLADGTHSAFIHATIAIWAGLASVLFLRRYLVEPSRKLLVLPIGAMAMLVALSALAPVPEPGTASGAIIGIHVIFMMATLTAHLVAAGSGVLYILASRQLKEGNAMALKLPKLSRLDRLCERSLIFGTGLLLGGLVTGGSAISASHTFTLRHPAAVLALLDMGVLVGALGLRTAGMLARRGVAWVSIVSALLLALGTMSFIALRHG